MKRGEDFRRPSSDSWHAGRIPRGRGCVERPVEESCPRRWGAYLPLLLGMFLLAPGNARADSAVPSRGYTEKEVKAAFLYNFVKFVEWPAEALGATEEPLRLCVLGADPFGGALEQMVQGRRVAGRAVTIAHLGQVTPDDRCHILFVSASENHRLGTLLAAVRDRSTLTVGEGDDFLRAGGMINFLLEDDRVRFQVNLAAAERAHLKISARLLAVAKEVVGGPMPGKG